METEFLIWVFEKGTAISIFFNGFQLSIPKI